MGTEGDRRSSADRLPTCVAGRCRPGDQRRVGAVDPLHRGAAHLARYLPVGAWTAAVTEVQNKSGSDDVPRRTRKRLVGRIEDHLRRQREREYDTLMYELWREWWQSHQPVAVK